MTKPHASQSLPTCATANEFSCHFSARETQGSVQFVFHCPSFANGPVLIFKTKTLHIVEGQVPGSSQCELFDLWTFKSFTASVLVLLSLSCWQSKKEQKAFQTPDLLPQSTKVDSCCFPSVNPLDRPRTHGSAAPGYTLLRTRLEGIRKWQDSTIASHCPSHSLRCFNMLQHVYVAFLLFLPCS